PPHDVVQDHLQLTAPSKKPDRREQSAKRKISPAENSVSGERCAGKVSIAVGANKLPVRRDSQKQERFRDSAQKFREADFQPETSAKPASREKTDSLCPMWQQKIARTSCSVGKLQRL